MEKIALTPETMKMVKLFQKNEITEYLVYSALAERVSGKNGDVLKKIARDENRHYHKWKEYSRLDVRPRQFALFFYRLIARIMGITFAIKMMEKGEQKAESNYTRIQSQIPEAHDIWKDEKEHELLLVDMIDEERIKYISSMVLGLNDALVELTGALAGFTLALRNGRLIGLAGLITGIAAALSMAASEYLSQKSEEEHKDPVKAAFYTGMTYLVAVILLVFPFFAFPDYYLALVLTLIIAIFIILIFAQFVAVVKDISFRKFFWEMVFISMGVALISFVIGWIARLVLNVHG
jgi:VIT1/CCC1 family predicted Fe2+/Mn2+ transporter